jgi:hypothetical protein
MMSPVDEGRELAADARQRQCDMANFGLALPSNARIVLITADRKQPFLRHFRRGI